MGKFSDSGVSRRLAATQIRQIKTLGEAWTGSVEFLDWLWKLGQIWSAGPAGLGPLGPGWFPRGRKTGDRILAVSFPARSAETAGKQDAIPARVLGSKLGKNAHAAFFCVVGDAAL